MIVSTLLMAVLAAILVGIGYANGKGQHIEGMRKGLLQFAKVLPLLVCVFIVIGMLPVLVPKDTFATWLGGQSGWRGILIGTLAGSIAPGGPLIHSVMAAGLLKAGAGAGAVVAFLTSGLLWAFALFPAEAGILGWRFMCLQFASTCVFPPIAGLIAQRLAPHIL